MQLLTIITNYPYEIIGALIGLPFVASWAGAHIGSRTGTKHLRRNYQRGGRY